MCNYKKRSMTTKMKKKKNKDEKKSVGIFSVTCNNNN